MAAFIIGAFLIQLQKNILSSTESQELVGTAGSICGTTPFREAEGP